MLNTVKNFLKDENGMGTVEIVIIVAVLVSVALIFKNTIYAFVTDIMDKIFKQDFKPTESTDSKYTP